MLIDVVGTGGAINVEGSGIAGIAIVTSPLDLEDFIEGCSTLLKRSLSAFSAICLL